MERAVLKTYRPVENTATLFVPKLGPHRFGERHVCHAAQPGAEASIIAEIAKCPTKDACQGRQLFHARPPTAERRGSAKDVRMCNRARLIEFKLLRQSNHMILARFTAKVLESQAHIARL